MLKKQAKGERLTYEREEVRVVDGTLFVVVSCVLAVQHASRRHAEVSSENVHVHRPREIRRLQ